jgi:SAM-dependent methyltransferase
MPAGERPSGTRAVRSYYRAILPFYEEEVACRRDLAFWSGLCRRWKPLAVLEIGCGLGVVTEAVAACAPTVGLDLSFAMVERARERLRRAGLNARLFVADARRPALAARFDLVLAPGDPFSHWTRTRDRRAGLRAIASYLTPAGRFVLDGLYRSASRLAPTRERRIGRDGGYVVRESWRPAGPPDVWTARYEYRRASPGSRAEAEAVLRARSWDPAGIHLLFESCGLFVEVVWGDFRRRPFSESSERILVVARRRLE